MEGFVVKNKYGNHELRVNDGKGGHVTVISNAEETRYFTGEIGMVASYTHKNVGSTEIIKTVEDIDNMVNWIEGIKRIDDAQKALLVDYLDKMKKREVHGCSGC